MLIASKRLRGGFMLKAVMFYHAREKSELQSFRTIVLSEVKFLISYTNHSLIDELLCACALPFIAAY